MVEKKEKFGGLKPEDNKGTGFFGKWAFWAMKKREWEESQKDE